MAFPASHARRYAHPVRRHKAIMDSAFIANKIEAIISQTQASENDQLALMVWVRHLLELNNLPNNFKVLWLYCNWILHPNVNQKQEHGKIIEKITDAILKMDHQGPPIGGKAIAKALLFEQLRDDFQRVFQQFGLPTQIFSNKKNWLSFLIGLITLLLEKPIELKLPKHQSSYNFITAKTNHARGLAIESVFFRFIHDYSGPNDPTICYVATNRGGVFITIPINFSLL